MTDSIHQCRLLVLDEDFGPYWDALEDTLDTALFS